MMAMMGGVEVRAQNAPKPAAAAGDNLLTKIPPGPPVRFGVIGMGAWGREILKNLALLPNAPVVAICDNYAASLRRAGNSDAPSAERFDDYQKLLASGFFGPDDTVVLFNTGSGLKYLDVLNTKDADVVRTPLRQAQGKPTPASRPIAGIIGPY